MIDHLYTVIGMFLIYLFYQYTWMMFVRSGMRVMSLLNFVSRFLRCLVTPLRYLLNPGENVRIANTDLLAASTVSVIP